MNTAKQVNVILGLFMVFLVGTTLYFVWDSSRADEATDRQLRVNVERGAHIFSLNCRTCHGITGQGALERSILPGAVLNIESNRPSDPDTGLPLLGALAGVQQKFTDTINCGRIGTRMPPWAQSQGGALNFYQIEQVVTFITGAKPTSQTDPPDDLNAASQEGWDFVWHEVNHADAFDPHKELLEAIGEEDTTLSVESTDPILVDAVLRLGGNVEEPTYELVKVTAIDADAGTLTVERGVEGSRAMAHEAGTEVFGGYVPPGESITGADGVFVCGQTVISSGGGQQAPTVQVADGDTIDIGDNFFDVGGDQNPTLEVKAGDSLTLDLVNGGKAIHNMQIAGVDGNFGTDDDFVSDPDAIGAGGDGTIEFSFDQPGTFKYQCFYHPTEMLGTIEVVE